MEIVAIDKKINKVTIQIKKEEELKLKNINNIISINKVNHDFRNHTDTYELIINDDDLINNNLKELEKLLNEMI